MGALQTWSITPKICDSCKTTPALVFCRPDSIFLCLKCDSRIHAANKLASRHARVSICEVCEQAPAVVTCKADAAALCSDCDGDIHSANPLASRHQRLPIVPFHGSASATKSSADELSEEEAEAASWLLMNPNVKPDEGYLFSDSDPFLDLDLISVEQRTKHVDVDEQREYSCDGVFRVQTKNEFESGQILGSGLDGFPTHDVDFPMYDFTSQSMSQSVSSSSMDIVVVPEHKSSITMDDAATNNSIPIIPISGIDREARVLRYREKRKSRRFEKTIRYASRKAYAETRPRIKGRFAKRLELDVDSFIAYDDDDASFCVVPTFQY